MKESIYTIPISEVFEPKDGCPLCRLRDTLEERAVEYILGAAMMEPDVREETNRLGFCIGHYRQMLARKSRLQMALTMQTRLAHLLDELEKPKIPSRPEKNTHTCYVCEKLDGAMSMMRANIYQMYAAHEDFRRLYGEQTGLCYDHCRYLLAGASALPRKYQKTFAEETARLCREQLDPLFEEVSTFCRQFDYRAQGHGGFGTSRDSIERSIRAVTGEDPGAFVPGKKNE